MRCKVIDLTTLDLSGTASQRRTTSEGFLEVPAAIAKADNVQPYRRRELGLDGDGNAIIRLFRPKSEVFAPKTVASFEGKTLTVDHPAKGVDASNWKKVTAGDVHDVKAAVEALTLMSMFLVKDADAIGVVTSNKKVQVSAGYDFDLELTPGRSPTGEAYDGIQTNIQANHVAIVDAARGGPELRVADRDPNNQNQEHRMKIRMVDRAIGGVTIPGFNLTVADDAAGTAAEDAMDRHGRACDDAMKAYDSMKAERDVHKERADAAETKFGEMEKAKKAGDAMIVELQKTQVTDAQIETRAAERQVVVSDALVLVPDFKTEGKSVAAIRTEVLTQVIASDEAMKPIVVAGLGGADVAKADAPSVLATFRVVAAQKRATSARGDDGYSASDDAARARDAALAGANDGDGAGRNPAKAGKAPRFLGMDAVNEANRLHHLGKHAEAETVLEEARQ